MCYSSSKDFGWGTKKDATREPDTRQQTPPDRPEPTYTAQDFTFWAFPRWRKTHKAGEPAAERPHEKV
jgi:hypothetical protein